VLISLAGHTSRVLSVSWSPDGGQIVTGSGTFDCSVKYGMLQQVQCYIP
jgi:WD40 repeat protein